MLYIRLLPVYFRGLVALVRANKAGNLPQVYSSTCLQYVQIMLAYLQTSGFPPRQGANPPDIRGAISTAKIVLQVQFTVPSGAPNVMREPIGRT